MTAIPSKAIESFGATGGILGLIVLLLVGFMVWYIHFSHRYRSSENAALAAERKEWRESLDKNTAAFHSVESTMSALVSAMQTKPCLRSPEARTRESDRTHR